VFVVVDLEDNQLEDDRFIDDFLSLKKSKSDSETGNTSTCAAIN
jgi:hypothetical protein